MAATPARLCPRPRTQPDGLALAQSGQHTELLPGSDTSEPPITSVDTGIGTSIDTRLRRVRRHLGDGEILLARYRDVSAGSHLEEITTSKALLTWY